METTSKNTQTSQGSVDLGDGMDNNGHAVTDVKRSPIKFGDDTKLTYSCNICLSTAQNAVVNMCGHLFCWRCLYHWQQTGGKLCPVCKALVVRSKVIPIYGRNSLTKTDDNVPPRPLPRRLERKLPWLISSFDDFIDLGFSPFVYGETPTDSERNEEQKLSWMFLFLVFICFAWLILS